MKGVATFLVWFSLVVFFIILVDYNYNPERYVYAVGNYSSNAQLWVIHEGWRNQVYITDGATYHPWTMDQVVKKMPLTEAPKEAHRIYYVLLCLAGLMMVGIIMRFYEIYKNKEKFRPLG